MYGGSFCRDTQHAVICAGIRRQRTPFVSVSRRRAKSIERVSAMPQITASRKVRFSIEEVYAFNEKWPCSTLRNRSYWFEFDARGDLVDTDVPEHDDGPAALVLSHDAQTFLNEESV
jgi:hypothetical protein